MKLLYPKEVEKELAFARKAGLFFFKNPEKTTFTDGPIEPGALMAIRWGAEPEKAHAVVVLKISDDFTPRIWGDLESDRVKPCKKP